MNTRKARLLACALVLGTPMVFAAELPVENYTYDTHLDIAKVISQDAIPDVCGVVPIKMRYLDHQGQEHLMQYLVMGNGCSNN